MLDFCSLSLSYSPQQTKYVVVYHGLNDRQGMLCAKPVIPLDFAICRGGEPPSIDENKKQRVSFGCMLVYYEMQGYLGVYGWLCF